MEIYGLETIQSDLNHADSVFKAICNERAVIFFSCSAQHCDVKQEGLSYEDEKGNALAVTVFPMRLDVRSHRYFTEERVRTIFRELLSDPRMTWAADYSVSYQGRDLIGG